METGKELMAGAPLAVGGYWNVNLPHVPPSERIPERVRCEPSKRPLPVAFDELSSTGNDRLFAYAGVYANREREAGSDINVCFGGRIAVSKLSL